MAGIILEPFIGFKIETLAMYGLCIDLLQGAKVLQL